MSKRYSILLLMAFSIAASRSHAASVANRTCTGNQGSVTMNSVYVESVTAAATSSSAMAPKTAYVDASLLYSSVSVAQAGSTIDDGGTSTPPNWDIGANKGS